MSRIVRVQSAMTLTLVEDTEVARQKRMRETLGAKDEFTEQEYEARNQHSGTKRFLAKLYRQLKDRMR